MRFSLRIDALGAPDDLVGRVEQALGSRLVEKTDHGFVRREVQLLGMTILFVSWVGVNGKPIYQLKGYSNAGDDWDDDVPLQIVRLDAALIDLLRRSGAGEWHEPTDEEIEAEDSDEAASAMEDEDPGPPDDWPPP